MKGKKKKSTHPPPAGLDETHACDPIPMAYRVSMPVRLSSRTPFPLALPHLLDLSPIQPLLLSKFRFHSLFHTFFFPYFFLSPLSVSRATFFARVSLKFSLKLGERKKINGESLRNFCKVIFCYFEIDKFMVHT